MAMPTYGVRRVGCADHPVELGGFNAMKPSPTQRRARKSQSPLDKERDGFVMAKEAELSCGRI